ncbi:hypothetical protein R75471_02130 [Paraburkholderia domus]|uniref:hypothetical protein n=1 Tax=Paraburkholderia domus TaxID=2793075 RepID=UPI001B24DBBE|nr:hypothetical protein [Paraburkholderia domus]CAE6886810.1 hypothetical protein R75471_02130 [Paraburkholderia domus]
MTGLPEFISGLSLLLNVKKFRGDQKLSYLKDVIDPLYKKLEESAADYNKMLTVLRNHAEDAASGLDAEAESRVKKEIRDLRDKMAIERRSVSGVAYRFEEGDVPEVALFGQRINEYFAFREAEDDELKSDVGRLIDELMEVSETSFEGKLRAAVPAIDGIKNRALVTWKLITRQYALLQKEATVR